MIDLRPRTEGLREKLFSYLLTTSFGLAPIACAAASPQRDVAPAPRAIVADVTPVATAEAALAAPSSETKRQADHAVTLAAELLESIEAECSRVWAPDSVCTESRFKGVAASYQAFYGATADPRRDQGRIDAVPRLGGPDVDADQLTARLVTECAHRCWTARSMTVSAAMDAAVAACAAKPSGREPCSALGREAKKTLSAREAEEITETCEGKCDASRADAAAQGARAARVRRTPQEEATCRAACEKLAADDFCGTPLVTCRARCAYR